MVPEEPMPVRLSRYLEAIGADAEARGQRDWRVLVPSQRRGAVAVGLSAGERTLAAHAFVLRGPDRRHEDVYRRLLGKNRETHPWRFVLDGDGDIFLVAHLPLIAISQDDLDELLGTLATIVDESYEGLVRMGFDVPEGTDFRPPPEA